MSSVGGRNGIRLSIPDSRVLITNMAEKNFVVISLGGSLIVPEGIDKAFLEQFKRLILKWVRRGKRFFIVAGGGRTTRNYQQAARETGVKDGTSLDQIGIYTTYINAELVRSMFGKAAHPEIIKDYSKKMIASAKIVVGSGWKPGCSTDFDAVLAAKKCGAKQVINLSNIKYIYDKDPKTHPEAQPIESMTFAELLKITGKVWYPGANTPFDPKAAQLACKSDMTVLIANGGDLENLDSLLADEPFCGTVVCRKN